MIKFLLEQENYGPMMSFYNAGESYWLIARIPSLDNSFSERYNHQNSHELKVYCQTTLLMLLVVNRLEYQMKVKDKWHKVIRVLCSPCLTRHGIFVIEKLGVHRLGDFRWI